MKYIDMFGGIGGFRYGIERATKGKWVCVSYYDIDKYAVQTYNKNFGENHQPTDIRTIKEDDVPEHDCICGGFPCQAFSIAGKRRGFEDTRGTLFFEIMRIAKAKRTKYLFLENVKGLLNHNEGKTFTTIIQALEELGYEFQWLVLNSKFHGVPQNRERVFIIANLRGERRPEILPFGEDAGEVSGVPQIKGIMNIYSDNFGEKNLFDISGIAPTQKIGGDVPMVVAQRGREDGQQFEPQENHTNSITSVQKDNLVMNTITQAFGRRGCSKEEMENGEKVMFDVYNKRLRDECPTLTDPCHNSIRFYTQEVTPQFDELGNRTPQAERVYSEDGINPALQSSQTIVYDRKGYDNISAPIKSSEGSGNQIIINNLRRLTPIECERLQGFPDNWTSGVSDTQRYKQLGNAVTTNVITAIVRNWVENGK